MALSDDETFTSQLNRKLGPIVYNAAETFDTALSAEKLIDTARADGMDSGWIVLEVLNRASFTYAPPQSRYSASRMFDQVVASVRDGSPGIQGKVIQAALPVIRFVRRMKHPYALTRLSALINMRLADDRFLPNPFSDLYPEEELNTGRRVLMYSGDIQFAQQPDNPGITARAILRLRDHLKGSGYHLAVILLPNSYSVYYPLLRNHHDPDTSERYMRELSDLLSAGSVAELNLLPTMRAAAQAELNQGRLIYYPDDAHWNALGCELAARTAAPWLGSLMQSAAQPGNSPSGGNRGADAIQ